MGGEATVDGPVIEITQERVQRYAEITGDFNPIHVDEAFARATPFGGVIAHGMLSLNLAWEVVRTLPGGDGDLELDVRFRKPVRPGDRVRARARREDGGWEVWIENQAGEAVIAGRARRGPAR